MARTVGDWRFTVVDSEDGHIVGGDPWFDLDMVMKVLGRTDEALRGNLGTGGVDARLMVPGPLFHPLFEKALVSAEMTKAPDVRISGLSEVMAYIDFSTGRLIVATAADPEPWKPRGGPVFGAGTPAGRRHPNIEAI